MSWYIKSVLCGAGFLLCGLAVGQTGQVDSTGQRTAGGQSPDFSLVDKLREEDSRFPEQYTVEFEIRSRGGTLGPDLGPWKKVCKYTVIGSVRVLTEESHYEALPVYERLGETRTQQIDYDRDGNLIHWRPFRKWALNTPETNVSRYESRLFIISPDGAILEEGRGTKHILYPIGSDDSVYEHNQFMLASGRGFSERMTEVVETKLLNGDAIALRAATIHPGGFLGRWDLVLEPSQHGALVRQAQFTFDQRSIPSTEVRTTGAINLGDVTIAESGLIVNSPGSPIEFRKDVSITSFSVEPDQEHVQSVKAIFEGPMPAYAQVFDWRSR